MTRKVSIAFIDDHPVILDGLSWFFSAIPDFEVLASGRCVDDALRIAETMRPDVLMMDLRMPGDPLMAIRRISASRPDTKIVAFTAMADVTCATRTLEAGASGYVLKGTTSEELSRAVRLVVAGENYITPAFATKVIAALREARNVQAESVKFSIREGQILTLLLRGCTNKEIGLRLSISEKTVRHYMTLLMRKLNVRNRLEVVLEARRCGVAWLEEIANAQHAKHLN